MSDYVAAFKTIVEELSSLLSLCQEDGRENISVSELVPKLELIQSQLKYIEPKGDTKYIKPLPLDSISDAEFNQILDETGPTVEEQNDSKKEEQNINANIDATMGVQEEKIDTLKADNDKEKDKTADKSSRYAVWNSKSQEFDTFSSYGDDDVEIINSRFGQMVIRHSSLVYKLNRDRMALPKYNKFKKDIKILFLDVDGVLNKAYGQVQLCDEQMQRLKTIVDKTNCKIVLSTSWRIMSFTKRRLLNGLKSMINIDVTNVVIGETPTFSDQRNNVEWYSDNDATNETNKTDDHETDDNSNQDKFGEKSFSSSLMDSYHKRPYEIKAYLENDPWLHEKYNVIKWCAVDDLPLENYNCSIMKGHFIRTKDTQGMQDIDMNNIINLLNGYDINQNESDESNQLSENQLKDKIAKAQVRYDQIESRLKQISDQMSIINDKTDKDGQ